MSMRLVFIGGGSLRTLPQVRAILAGSRRLHGATIIIHDHDAARGAAVASILEQAPEVIAGAVTVCNEPQLDAALEGADVVSLAIPVGSALTCARSEEASVASGCVGSDQLSLSGAFRSLTGGAIVLDLARRMARHCPRAWLLCFANPVAVYSALVNNHTPIRCLGVCEGFLNHRWDLTRLLLGRDEHRDDYRVAVAGVNHLSFIVRGRWRGGDLLAALAESKPPSGGDRGPRSITWGLRWQRESLRRYGQAVFSGEGDGLMVLFPEAMPPSPRQPAAALPRVVAAAGARRHAAFAAFAAQADRRLPPAFWRAADRAGSGPFARARSGAMVEAVRALAGERRWLVASRPNRGAVAGFDDRTVLEHSFTLCHERLLPDAGLAVAPTVRGLVCALADHQTLLADAIAAQDARLFARALAAWPIGRGTAAPVDLCRELLRIHAAEIPTVFRQAGRWL
jgi:alpha-galactosidase/6-phospho-beta-glucosidase family protein